jgi:putative DNA primase/helicase
MTEFNLGSAAALAESLGGVSVGDGRYRAPCPACGRRNLQIRDGETRLLLCCWNGCRFEEITAALGIGRPTPPEVSRSVRSVTGAIAAARAIYDRAEPAAGTPAESYLRSRGIKLPLPPSLRFHPSAPHRSGWYYPSLVAAVQNEENDENELVGVHLTYLQEDGTGKHAFPDPAMQRECRGPIGGGAVRLAAYQFRTGEPLLVGEGVESTLSAMQIFGVAGWAALSTAGLRALQLPPEIDNIAIAVDHDVNGAGQAAAAAALTRWRAEGRTVRCLVPPHPGDDFNDVLLRGAAP